MKEDKTSKKFWLVFGVYLLLSILLFDPKLHTGGDNARYIILGESLSRFAGFSDLHLPGTPPHTQYPFGFPLLLVPWLWVFGANLVLLKMVPLLCGLGAFVFFGLLMRRLLNKHYLWPMLIFATTPILIEYNHWLFSEMPFIFFSLAGLYFLSRSNEARRYFFLGSLCTVYAYFIRTAGITLIIGVALALAAKKDWKHLVIFAVVFLVPFGLWQYRSSRIPQEWSYFQQLMARDPYHPDAGSVSAADMVMRIISNFSLYLFSVLGSSLLPKLPGPFLEGLAGVAIFALVVHAFILRIRRLDFIDFYFLAALALLMVWPRVWSGDRFLLPVLPLVVIYVFVSSKALFEKLRLKHGLIGLVAVFVLINSLFIVPAMGRGFRSDYPIGWRQYFEVCRWARANVPAGAVIMARKPEFVYFLSGHQSMLYSFTRDEIQLASEIDKVDFILFDTMFGQTTEFLLPVIEKTPERFPIVYQTTRPEFYLLRVLK